MSSPGTGARLLDSQAARTTAAARAADTPVERCARTKGTRISTPPARAAQMRTRCESCVPIQGMRARETMSAPKIAPRVLARTREGGDGQRKARAPEDGGRQDGPQAAHHIELEGVPGAEREQRVD